jgi:hypothetical protein
MVLIVVLCDGLLVSYNLKKCYFICLHVKIIGMALLYGSKSPFRRTACWPAPCLLDISVHPLVIIDW